MRQKISDIQMYRQKDKKHNCNITQYNPLFTRTNFKEEIIILKKYGKPRSMYMLCFINHNVQ